MAFQTSPFLIIAQANMASAIASGPIQMIHNYGFSIQATFTTAGTLAGVLKIQTSLDGSTWNDLANSPLTLTGAGSWSWTIAGSIVNFPFVQLVYVPAAGDSGNLNALFNI
jgi:hypothetical protein